MEDWKHIKIDGIGRIERIVAEFYVWSNKVPNAKFKVRIKEEQTGGFAGYVNLAVKDQYGGGDWTIGYGKTVSEALEDAIHSFLETLEGYDNLLQDEDFEWSDPHDF